MIQDKEVNNELKVMAQRIWDYIGKVKTIPDLETKQGGSSGKYYKGEHTIRIRSNVWKKISLGGKRMLLIHELWHSIGINHNGLFLHSFDLLTIELYFQIYGKDEAYIEMENKIKKEIKEELGVDKKCQ